MKYVDEVTQERKPFFTSKVRPASTSDVIAGVTFDSVGRGMHEVISMLNDRFTDAGIVIPDREVRRVAAFICGVPFEEAEPPRPTGSGTHPHSSALPKSATTNRWRGEFY